MFFTPLSQQVIRNHISEMEKSTKIRFFMKVHTHVGEEIQHLEGKNLGSKGPPRLFQPRPLTRRALAGLKCIDHTCDSSLFRRYLPIFCPFLRKSPYQNFRISFYILNISLFPSLFNHSPCLKKKITSFPCPKDVQSKDIIICHFQNGCL